MFCILQPEVQKTILRALFAEKFLTFDENFRMISLLDSEFSSLHSFLKNKNYTQIFILVDENTHLHCLPTLLGNLETEIPFEIIEIEAGEEMKTIETAAQLWQILAEFQADRKSLLINLGGGVITDLGGFVGSTYKRGIQFIHIPTTLLGMCDASIGGKTGVDLDFLKNMVGTFSHPEQIFVYPPFLKSLNPSELISGFAEMLKHGLIADEKHWKNLTSLPQITAESLFPYIEDSMKIKENVVEKDFREENIRKTLNFGHSIGHAVESLFLKNNLPIKHGEAVAIGMICETQLSFLENLITETEKSSIIHQILQFFPKRKIAFSNDEILELMHNDKKNTSGKINFSLLYKIGGCKYDVYPKKENIISSIEFYKNL